MMPEPLQFLLIWQNTAGTYFKAKCQKNDKMQHNR